METNVAVAPLLDGRLQIWVIDENGNLWSRWKIDTSSTSDWTAWEGKEFTLPDSHKASQIAVAPLLDRRLQIWAIDENGNLWSKWQKKESSTSSWTAWEGKEFTLPHSHKASQIAGAPLLDRRLQIWAIDENGNLWSRWKKDTSSTSDWTAWDGKEFTLPDSHKASQIAGAPLLDGRLQIWAIDENGNLWSRWKKGTSSTSDWTAWEGKDFTLPDSHKASRIAGALLPDGRLQIWAIDENGNLWSRWKKDTSSTSDWTAWDGKEFTLPDSHKASQIAGAFLPDGRLQIWAIDENGNLWSRWKKDTSSTSDWTAWTKW